MAVILLAGKLKKKNKSAVIVPVHKAEKGLYFKIIRKLICMCYILKHHFIISGY
jgi:hypothetical protein